MLLRKLFEAPSKKAVLGFGRLNPPTVGHAKLVDTITGIEGDHYLFLSHTQKPKTDPLDFETKLKFAKQFFSSVEVGHPSVKTPVQALEFLQSKGYTDIVFVAGSDRVEGFQKLFDTYNGQADKTGKVPFKFNSIRVISAGERDPDADDVSGMSASKMRALAAQGELESFAQGVPDKRLAKTMFDAVRNAMGVKDNVVADSLEEDNLTELFDKPYPYTLDIGSDKATARISLPDGTNLRVGFLKGKTQWDMAFDRDGTFDADDQGDQFKVMATVVAAFKEFVEKVKPAKITFDADKDSTNSRVDVYAKMLNRYADKMGYGFTAKNPEGDSIIQYTLTKGKPNVKNTTQPQKDVPAAKTSTDLPMPPTDAPIKKLALSMWDESRLFNLHKAGKVDLGDAIAKLSPEDQVWAKLRWQQGLRLGQIGKKYNLDNTKSIQKYKLIHDKIRQNLGLKDTAAENTSLDEAEVGTVYMRFTPKKTTDGKSYLTAYAGFANSPEELRVDTASRKFMALTKKEDIIKAIKTVLGDKVFVGAKDMTIYIDRPLGKMFPHFDEFIAWVRQFGKEKVKLEYKPDSDTKGEKGIGKKRLPKGHAASADKNYFDPETATTKYFSIDNQRLMKFLRTKAPQIMNSFRPNLNLFVMDQDQYVKFRKWLSSESVVSKFGETGVKIDKEKTFSQDKGRKFEDASPEEEDDFHVDLDKLVHKYFGHSSDEKKIKH